MTARHTYKLKDVGTLPEGIANLTELSQLVSRIKNGEFYSEDVLCIEYGQSRDWVIAVEIAARKTKLLTSQRNLVWYFPSTHKCSDPTPSSPCPPPSPSHRYDDLTEARKKDLRKILLDEQDMLCAICGNSFPTGRKPALDHCHETGKIRGVLCCSCNIGLGCFGDSVMMLERAMAYLIGSLTIRPRGTA